MIAALLCFVIYGLWRGRQARDLPQFLVAGRSMPWPMVALSVMATQASAVTFLATPGQGYVAGLSFIQFYFGLPLAMVALCATLVPFYQRFRVYTAYEFLERRFDGKTRTLAAALFLIQRGLSAGVTLYAPALVLSVVLGWGVGAVSALIGALVIGVITLGGSRAVSHSHALQFSIIIATMVVAFAVVVRSLPGGLGLGGALEVAGRAGKLDAVDLRFDPASRYNLWAGLIGGFFLQLSYFGADQSQVGRILTAHSSRQSRLGLLFNGLVKVPMQFFILLLGVLVFVFYQFRPAPVFFDPAGTARAAHGPHAREWQAAEADWNTSRGVLALALDRARRARAGGDAAAERAARLEARGADSSATAARTRAIAVLGATDPKASRNDTNYVFLRFVLDHLPAGLVGLVLAAIFAASMNVSSSELTSLATTTVIDVVQRLPRAWDERALLLWSRGATVFWTLFAVGFAQLAGRLGSLVEAVNILGSLFYGTILGIFLTAILVRRAHGTAVFVAAIVAEAAVIACWKLTPISFLWYNAVGCGITMGLAWVFSLGRRDSGVATAGAPA
jgi:Na+/proline symporter